MTAPQMLDCVYKVRTFHGTVLGVDPTGRRVTHVGDDQQATKVVLFISSFRPELGFLLSFTDQLLSIGRRQPVRSFQTLIVEPHEITGSVKLYDPFSGLFLTSVPIPAQVVPHTTTTDTWECFQLIPVQHEAQFELMTNLLTNALKSTNSAPIFLNFLKRLVIEQQTTHISTLVSLALLAMSEETSREFCDAFFVNEDTSAPLDPTLSHINSLQMPYLEPIDVPLCKILDLIDPAPWFAESWRMLATWLRDRPTISGGLVGPQYDFMGMHTGTESFTSTSPGHLFLRKVRRLVVPRHELALLATARDEGVYLLEWIAHHQAMGVEKIYLYSNNNTDGSDELLAALQDAGVIVWFDNTPEDILNINLQRKAYGHALIALPEILDYRWTLILDLDEFITIHPYWNKSLPALLRARHIQGADTVAFQWNIYFSDRQLYWLPEPCGERYNRVGGNPLVKNAFLTNHFSFSDAHHPLPRQDEPNTWLTVDGQIQYGAGAKNDIAWINGTSRNGQIAHFAIKSLEEFIWKYARGENDGSGVIIKKHFRYNTEGVISNYLKFYNERSGHLDNRFQVLLPEIHQRIEILKSLPNVGSAYQRVVKNYRTQIVPLVYESLEVVKSDDRLTHAEKESWARLIADWSVQRDIKPVI